ncbi:nucleotidyltransferase family protein [Candidatus Margulisiibacteriota bacterium]
MLNKQNIIKRIESQSSHLRQDFSVNKIGLFGSFERGEQKKNSDVD